MNILATITNKDIDKHNRSEQQSKWGYDLSPPRAFFMFEFHNITAHAPGRFDNRRRTLNSRSSLTTKANEGLTAGINKTDIYHSRVCCLVDIF